MVDSAKIDESDPGEETEREQGQGDKDQSECSGRNDHRAQEEQCREGKKERPEHEKAAVHHFSILCGGARTFLSKPARWPCVTDLLWMPASDGERGAAENPNYVRRFDAKVQKTLEDWILLDRTAFYAEGGGQPSDLGLLSWDGGETRVKHVSKKGAVKHVVEGALPPAGATVHGEIDWDLRLRHMRMHTSQHIVSGVIWKLRAGRTVGNQLHADRSRIDLEPAKFSNDDLRDIETEVNRVLALDLPVRCYEEDRSALEARLGQDRNLLNLVPQSVKRLRVVEVYDPKETLPEFGRTIDVCPCAGTHVARTAEIGRFEIVARETKGVNRDRIEYVLKGKGEELSGTA